MQLNKSVLNKKVNWRDTRNISITIYGGLYSYDSDILTRLIVLCFDRMVRLEINPKAFRYLELVFTYRSGRSGEFYSRLPTLEDHVAFLRKNIGLEIK